MFNVIAQRDSWDDGLMESDLVDNLDDCTSLTYTVTKGIGPGTACVTSLCSQYMAPC